MRSRCIQSYAPRKRSGEVQDRLRRTPRGEKNLKSVANRRSSLPRVESPALARGGTRVNPRGPGSRK
jgi:hypothetical protein